MLGGPQLVNPALGLFLLVDGQAELAYVAV